MNSQRHPKRILLILLGVALLSFLLHLGMGSSDSTHLLSLRFTPWEIISELIDGNQPGTSAINDIVWSIRLPRAVACILTGGILGLVGAIYQGLFRNPIAEPYTTGVSSGAAVGGSIALLLGLSGTAYGLGILLFAFLGGVGAILLVLSLSSIRGRIDVQRLLLSGVVIGAMLTALLMLILSMAGQDTNQILRWLLGSMTPPSWSKNLILAILLASIGGYLLTTTKALNVFAVGEETAARLGIDTKKLKNLILIFGSLLVSASVGAYGIIGFLGLISPHIARRLVGIDWRWSTLGSMLVAMPILSFADVIAQWGVPGGELPVGVITALVGAPVLILILKKHPHSTA